MANLANVAGKLGKFASSAWIKKNSNAHQCIKVPCDHGADVLARDVIGEFPFKIRLFPNCSFSEIHVAYPSHMILANTARILVWTLRRFPKWSLSNCPNGECACVRSNLTGCQMACMVDFVVLSFVSFLILVFSKPKIRNDSNYECYLAACKLDSLLN